MGVWVNIMHQVQTGRQHRQGTSCPKRKHPCSMRTAQTKAHALHRHPSAQPSSSSGCSWRLQPYTWLNSFRRSFLSYTTGRIPACSYMETSLCRTSGGENSTSVRVPAASRAFLVFSTNTLRMWPLEQTLPAFFMLKRGLRNSWTPGRGERRGRVLVYRVHVLYQDW